MQMAFTPQHPHAHCDCAGQCGIATVLEEREDKRKQHAPYNNLYHVSEVARWHGAQSRLQQENQASCKETKQAAIGKIKLRCVDQRHDTT